MRAIRGLHPAGLSSGVSVESASWQLYGTAKRKCLVMTGANVNSVKFHAGKQFDEVNIAIARGVKLCYSRKPPALANENNLVVTWANCVNC